MKEKWPAVTIKIFGEDYRIKGVKDPGYIAELAGFLDGKMTEVAANTQLTSSSKIAILAALNVCDELYKAKKTNELHSRGIKEKIKGLIRLIESAL